ncbi:MAG: UDP-N-acetylmuramate dehydrogenase [Planctomycetaceae bacterium]|nr:UDP-N-acetylmuramate dehydrogenase [Planctomycetaceae bacterium]
MSSLEDFAEITRRDEPLAPYTWLRIGGPAQYLIEPRTPDELEAVVRCCDENGIPLRLLGGGSNLLVSDEGVGGVTLRLNHENWTGISVEGTTVTAGAGASLGAVISVAVKAGLAGLESLAGIPGTIGGALRGNAGGRAGDIGQFVQSVDVMTVRGQRFTRTEDELSFAYRQSSIDELAILSATFQLKEDDPDEITRRMRKLWVMKKATQPLAFQSAGCIFRNPRGLSAGTLIEQSGLKGTRIGQAEISERHANFFVTSEGATSADVLRLIELARSRVAEQFGVDLELEIRIW